MKSKAIIRIVIFSFLILLFLSLLTSGIVFGSLHKNFSFSFHTSYLNDGTISSSGTLSAQDVRDIEIRWFDGSVTVQTGDTDTITFSETETNTPEDTMVWKLSNGKLILQYSQPKKVLWFSVGYTSERQKDLVITVPRDWYGGKFEIDSVLSRIDVSQISAQKMELDTVSGTCAIRNCTLNELSIDTVSGNVDFSGKLNILNCDTVSADCTAILTDKPRQIEMDSVSGDLSLTLPADTGFTVELDSVSGSLSSDFSTTTKGDRYYCGDGSCKIDADTVSGDIQIYKR